MDLRNRLAQLETRLGVGRDRPPSPLAEGRTPIPLSARLQRLVAAQADMPARRVVSQEELAQLLGGELCADGVVLIDSFLPASASHGRVPFRDIQDVSLNFLAGGKEPKREGLLFIDTETTGLAGGTGTVAFVLGFARLEDDVVHVNRITDHVVRQQFALHVSPHKKFAGLIIAQRTDLAAAYHFVYTQRRWIAEPSCGIGSQAVSLRRSS